MNDNEILYRLNFNVCVKGYSLLGKPYSIWVLIFDQKTKFFTLKYCHVHNTKNVFALIRYREQVIKLKGSPKASFWPDLGLIVKGAMRSVKPFNILLPVKS